MGVLRVRNHKKINKLIGVSIPLWVHNYLSLYSVAKNTTKSNITRGWIDAWYSQVKDRNPPERLIQEIVDTACKQWSKIKKETPEITVLEFKTELEKELMDKGLSSVQIGMITKTLH
jgi:hypothetical protein